MKYLLILIIMMLSLQTYGDEEPIHEEWISNDVIFLTSLKNNFRENPLSVLPLLEPDQGRKRSLGYGYSYTEGSMGKGYVRTYFKIIYKDEKPISYKLTQNMPIDDRLKSRYIKLFDGLYTFYNQELQPLYFNKAQADSPLESCGTKISGMPGIQNLMSPYSGLLYGSRGGYANTLLQNRKEYINLKSGLNDQLHEYLLCSKNPATRLTAIEYFTSKQLDNSPELAARIEEIFKETPSITTLVGCSAMRVDARELVHTLSTQKIQ